jgi:amidohydrolase|tara:strand:+ start:3399 stop:4730 length:1332 start_codon:yes stop_codon:yes gene_type:complete
LKYKDEIKNRLCKAIDDKSDQLIELTKSILNNPETGFKEFQTSKLVSDQFKALGIPTIENIAITGVKGVINSDVSGPTIAVIGELDSLKVYGHPHADKKTSAAHACGHHCQIGMMIAVATAFKVSGVLDYLSGNLVFIAVPAEEYIEIEYRDNLRKEGKIEFLGGKPEFIRLGAFDDVDIAMMTHTADSNQPGKIAFGGTNNGIVAKRIKFIGKAAHAGGAPHDGINALNAANIALSAIHAQRETFREKDTIRIHPIITNGGLAVSSVPSEVTMETYVRGASIEAFLSASDKVDRSLKAGALAVGGAVEITTLPGYLPIKSNETILEHYEGNAKTLVGENNVKRLTHRTSSTDMGDLSQLMPIIHPYVVAATGTSHGDNYLVKDYELGVITGAKAMAMTVVDLLMDGGELSHKVIQEYDPPLNKSTYIELMRGMFKNDTFDYR